MMAQQTHPLKPGCKYEIKVCSQESGLRSTKNEQVFGFLRPHRVTSVTNFDHRKHNTQSRTHNKRQIVYDTQVLLIYL